MLQEPQPSQIQRDASGREQEHTELRAPDQHRLESAGTIGDLIRRSWDVLAHPSVATFDRQRRAANWRVAWVGLLALAIVEAIGVAAAIYGPDASAGYSSLPIGPKLRLPQTSLLPFAAFVGSIGQFFAFAALLYLSARLLGGRGDYKTQAYLMALFWIPLMIASDLVELLPGPGSLIGLAIRLYALYLLVPALAAAHVLSPRRALAALLLPVAGGLLLGVAVLALAWPHLQPLLR
jgi:hypothetical protein